MTYGVKLEGKNLKFNIFGGRNQFRFRFKYAENTRALRQAKFLLPTFSVSVSSGATADFVAHFFGKHQCDYFLICPPRPQRMMLLPDEALGPHPEASKRFQVVLVSAGHGVLLSPLDSEHVFSGAPRLDFFNKGAIHKHRAMNPDESVRLELFRDRRDGLAKEVRPRLSLE